MLKASPAGAAQVVYRGPNEIDVRQRLLALGAVAALHAVVVGGFVIAQLRPPPPPPEETLSVSFITEAIASAAPASAPPQPSPPPPEPQMLATTKPTPSPMTAPPIEPEPRRETPKAAQPAPAAPSAATASPSAGPSSTAARAVGDPGATTTTPPNFSAAYLNNPRPVYPPAAKFRGHQGTVELRVQVGADGGASQVLINRSSGHKELDEAAQDVVKKRWRFVPAKQGDRAIAGWVIVPLEFELKKSR